jgi:hypothetical protein
MTRDFSPNRPQIITYDKDDDTVIIDINYINSSKVQPGMDDLASNMDDDDEVLNLGKLEYSLDYDFQKQEV